MKALLSFLSIAMILVSTSCSSLNSSQKRELADWDLKDLKVEEKSEGLAAGLNVLPGVGDFYNGNIGLGVVNLLFWPVSILWAPVGGASGAAEVNYYSTKNYVDTLETQRKNLELELQTALMTKQISNEEFFIASQKIKTMQLKEFKKSHTYMEFIPRLGDSRIPSSLPKN